MFVTLHHQISYIMEKEQIIKDSVEIFSTSMENAIQTIAQDAYQKGFEAGYEKAKNDLGMSGSSIVIIDGLEFYDMQLSDGALIAILKEKMPYFEAAKYNLPTVEQMKEIHYKTRVDFRGLIFPNGLIVDVDSPDFFWCKCTVDEQSEVEGIQICRNSAGNKYKQWNSCFTGENKSVIIIKNKV